MHNLIQKYKRWHDAMERANRVTSDDVLPSHDKLSITNVKAKCYKKKKIYYIIIILTPFNHIYLFLCLLGLIWLVWEHLRYETTKKNVYASPSERWHIDKYIIAAPLFRFEHKMHGNERHMKIKTKVKYLFCATSKANSFNPNTG